MNLLGTYLTLLIGPSIPAPAPVSLSTAICSVTVTHTDDPQKRSGFEIVFGVGRDQTTGLSDYDLSLSPLLTPYSRVILVVTFGGVPQVLMDGLITQVQLSPSNEPGASTLTVTGEDVSLAMDLAEKSAEHPGMSEMVIATVLIAEYAQYGLVPLVTPPGAIDVPLPTDRIPTQQGTDLAFLRELATRFGYVFYIIPGPAPAANIAYWGPPMRSGVPQPALSYNLGPSSNVRSMQFQHNALAPTAVTGSVQDRTTNQTMPIQSTPPTRAPLSSLPTALAYAGRIPTTILRANGQTSTQALALAQARADASSDSAATASGELDAGSYGTILQARALVGVRGAGQSFDGTWYVKSVTHKLGRGSYTQSFELSRDGVGSATAAVIP